MAYPHIYEPRAILEYEEALLWYLERSRQAGEQFKIEVSEKIHEICTHPTLYRNTKKHFRETFIKKYPFSIIYFFDKELNTVVIFSIFHNKRDQKRKYTR